MRKLLLLPALTAVLFASACSSDIGTTAVEAPYHKSTYFDDKASAKTKPVIHESAADKKELKELLGADFDSENKS